MKDKQQTFGKGLAEALAVGKANRIAEVQKRLAPKIQWTQSPPTEEGDYWWCRTKESTPIQMPVEYDEPSDEFRCHGRGFTPKDMGGWWAPVVAPAPPGDEALAWSGQQNARRCELIDKEAEYCASKEELVELEELQARMLAYRRTVAPLPIEEARQILKELKDGQE